MIYHSSKMLHQSRRWVLAFLCGATIGFSGTSAGSGEFVRITPEAEFSELVVNKKLRLDKNYLVIKKNGSIKGKFGGKTLKGTWAWRDGYWCRTLTTHSKNTDCQLWTVNGNQHQVTRDRGNGETFIYIVK